MKNTKKIIISIIAIAAALAVAVGLYYLPGMLGVSTADEDAVTGSGSTAEDAGFVTVPAVSVSTELPESDATITFSDSGVTVTGSSGGVKAEGTEVTISVSGVYTITGSCAEGNVKVKKNTTDVTLILQDLDLACSTTAPLSLNKSTSTVVYISGTVTLTDNEDEADDTGEETSTFEGSAIKVKSGATAAICGDGVLNIEANCKNGIKGAATASVTIGGSVTVNINAVNHGLASDGSVTVESGTLNIVAGNEGIKSKPDDGDTDSEGCVTITGGTISITSQDDGIWAANDVTISGGTITIDSGDDAVHATNITVTAGSLTIVCKDDAFHAADALTIGVDGSETGPEINVTESHEGFEAVTVNLYSGYGAVIADDDGINASGGTSGSAFGEGGGSSSIVNITGGTWYINSDGDGIDSNGDISITGGSVVVYGATDNGNAAFDYDGTATLTGGNVLAIGMSGMAQAPNGTVLSFTANISGGDTIVIADADGNTVVSSGGIKSANSIIYASADLVEGDTYTLYVNGTAAATAAAGTYTGFSMGGFGGGMGGNMGGGFGGGPQNGSSDGRPGRRG